jgi:hypothetical protein
MNRARARLAELLHVEDEEDLGTDRVLGAALSFKSTTSVATGRTA